MANIKDIAKKAGVSVATVSRVINNKSDVSEVMRNYILKIMNDVGYVPNLTAKNLSHRTSNLIAVMLPVIDTPFFSELITEIENEANTKGYNIQLFISNDDRVKVDFYLNSMKSSYVCGAIINSLSISSDDIESLEKCGIKTITLDRTPDDHSFSFVRVDHFVGGKLAAKHLIDSGCKKPIMISGSKDDSITNLRTSGFKEVLSDKLGIDDATVLYSDLTSEGGYSSMKRYFEKNESFDGVFCANDAMAFGAMRACADVGLRIPEDIIFIGYDNSTMGEFYLPRISSIDQRLKRVGKLCVDTIVSLIKENSLPVHQTVHPKLVIRDSTKYFKKH